MEPWCGFRAVIVVGGLEIKTSEYKDSKEPSLVGFVLWIISVDAKKCVGCENN